MPETSINDLSVVLARIEERLANIITEIRKDLKLHDERIKGLEDVGKRRLESVIAQIISLLIAAAVGGLIAKI